MKNRIISALVMILLLGPLIYAGGLSFSIAVGLLSVLALKEFFDLKKSHHQIPNTIQLVSSILLVILVFYQYEGHALSYGISHRLLIIIILLYLLPTLRTNEEYNTQDAFYLLGVIIFLGIAFNSLIVIRQISLPLFIYIILIPIITDTFAYLIGKKYGKRPLSKKISPNKTIEGFIAGILSSTIICSGYYYFFVASKSFLQNPICITLILAIAGEFGDLLFSKIKRENNIKDFSYLIPGHGGVLDRFDSLIFVVLVYVIMLKFI